MMQAMKQTYSFFSEHGNGSWEINDDSVKMKGWKNKSIKRSHVMSFEKMGDLALSKVLVEMKCFDMFGGNEALQFAMREADFRAMKKALGK